MTYTEACEKAAKVSRETGCVQHVEKSPSLYMRNGKMSEDCYTVSDWYDWETTVASYVNGKEV